MLAWAAAEKTYEGLGWVWLLSQPGHHMALQEKLPSSRHFVPSDFGFRCPWAEKTCQESATAPTCPPRHPPSCGGLILYKPPGKPGYGINNKKITNWSRSAGLLRPTEPPTPPAASLRDQDASTRQPTLSPLSGGPPARPGILHSNLQQTTARRMMRWTNCFQCWRGKVAPKQ